MNGFLGQLAALTLHRVETLPPRLPGRFETGSAEPADLDPFDLNTETAPSVANPLPAVREPTPAALNLTAASKVSVGEGAKTGDTRFVSSQLQVSAVPQAEQASPVSPPLKSPLSSSRSEAVVEARTPASAIAVAPMPDREITRIEERVTTLTQRERVVSRDAGPAGATIPRTRQPEPESVKPLIPVAVKSEPIVPAGFLRQESASRQPAEINPEPVTAPTIQVTIGRIEIRATQISDKAAAKPRPAQATLSLDDYLKQRDGGRS